jgi:hypothetical protein
MIQRRALICRQFFYIEAVGKKRGKPCEPVNKAAVERLWPIEVIYGGKRQTFKM